MTTTADTEIDTWAETAERAATLFDPQKFVETFYKQQTRPDGRLFGQARAVRVQHGILPQNTAGSAMVTFHTTTDDDDGGGGGNSSAIPITNTSTSRINTWGKGLQEKTVVIAGITLQIGQPTTSQECPAGQGDAIVTCVMPVEDTPGTGGIGSPVSVPILQSLLQRIMDVTIPSIQFAPSSTENDELGAITTTHKSEHHPLLIRPGRAAWRLMITLQILQNAGNLFDSSLLAIAAALIDLRLPHPDTVQLDQLTGRFQVLCDSPSNPVPRKLHFPIIPMALTTGFWYNAKTATTTVVVDPSASEEDCLESILSCVVNGTQPQEILLLDASTTNAGTGTLTPAQYAMVAQLASQRANELYPILFP